MKYSGVEVDENSKAVICPKCENEEVDEGDYCKICGTKMINQCAPVERINEYNGDPYIKDPCEKGSHLPGNARYCPYCGNESTFFQDGSLKTWQEVRKDQEDQKTQVQFDDEIEKLFGGTSPRF